MEIVIEATNPDISDFDMCSYDSCRCDSYCYDCADCSDRGMSLGCALD